MDETERLTLLAEATLLHLLSRAALHTDLTLTDVDWLLNTVDLP